MDKEAAIKIAKFLIPAGTFILGLLAKYYFDLFKNKIPKLRYTIDKFFLGASGQDNLYGNVQVLYNEEPVQNLHLCTMNLVNSSNKDFKNVEITVWCDVQSLILVSHAQKSNTIAPLQWTSGYAQEFENRNEYNVSIVWTKRVYDVPVLNRDDSITLSCLVTNTRGVEPQIYLSCDHPGLKIKPCFVQPQLFWRERQDAGALWGLVIGGFMLIPITLLIESKILVGIISLLLGAFCLLPGILLLKLNRIIRNWFR